MDGVLVLLVSVKLWSKKMMLLKDWPQCAQLPFMVVIKASRSFVLVIVATIYCLFWAILGQLKSPNLQSKQLEKYL